MNTNMKNGRIFGILIWILSAAITLMMFPLKAYAEDTQTVMLNASGDRAEIVLDFPQAAAEEISSLQISLRVSVNSSSAKVEFVQAELPAKIVESRYHSDTNILNIYIAGTKPLFNKSNPVLSLGYVKISGEGSAAADVEIVKDSLKFVRGTELVVQDSGVDYPDAVRISYSSGGNSDNSGGEMLDPIDPPSVTQRPSVTESSSVTEKPAETEKPASTERPASTEKPAVTNNTAGNEKPPVTNAPEVSDNSSVVIYPPVTEGQGGGNSPAVVPGTDVTLGADTSALVSAVDVAESLNKSDFSEESYKSLMEAIDSAKALLGNIYATQDEVDEALLVVENAIGMLELKNTPSGGDVTDSEGSEGQGGNGVQNDPQGSGSNGGDPSSDGRPNSGDGSGGENADDPSSNSENGDGNDGNSGDSDNNVSAWVIVLIVIGVLLAAALAATYVTAMGKKKPKKSKGKNKGKHTKSEE